MTPSGRPILNIIHTHTTLAYYNLISPATSCIHLLQPLFARLVTNAECWKIKSLPLQLLFHINLLWNAVKMTRSPELCIGGVLFSLENSRIHRLSLNNYYYYLISVSLSTLCLSTPTNRKYNSFRIEWAIICPDPSIAAEIWRFEYDDFENYLIGLWIAWQHWYCKIFKKRQISAASTDWVWSNNCSFDSWWVLLLIYGDSNVHAIKRGGAWKI